MLSQGRRSRTLLHEAHHGGSTLLRVCVWKGGGGEVGGGRARALNTWTLMPMSLMPASEQMERSRSLVRMPRLDGSGYMMSCTPAPLVIAAHRHCQNNAPGSLPHCGPAAGGAGAVGERRVVPLQLEGSLRRLE